MIVLSQLTIPVAIVVFGLTVVMVLVGIVYRELRARVAETERELDEAESSVRSMKHTLYGNSENDRDDGLTAKVNDVENAVSAFDDSEDDSERR